MAAPENDVSSEFPYELHRVPVLGLEMAYVDTHPEDARKSTPTALFIHGNPTSSYLYRNIIRHVSPLMRCVAPDLIGMGQSAKTTDIEYRFSDHYTFLSAFIRKVIPNGPVLLVIQDWGSALGFYWAYRQAEEFAPEPSPRVLGLAFMEFIRPFPTWDEFAPGPTQDAFRAFRDPARGRQMIVNENAFIETMLPRALIRVLSTEERDAYAKPFLEPASREPIFRWPNEIPIEGHPSDTYDMTTRYHNWLLDPSNAVPKLFFWATPGRSISPETAQWYAERLVNVRVVDLGQGMHFLQEDHPKKIGTEIHDWAKQILRDRRNP